MLKIRVMTYPITAIKGMSNSIGPLVIVITNEELIKSAAIITTSENLLTIRSSPSSSNLTFISPLSIL